MPTKSIALQLRILSVARILALLAIQVHLKSLESFIRDDQHCIFIFFRALIIAVLLNSQVIQHLSWSWAKCSVNIPKYLSLFVFMTHYVIDEIYKIGFYAGVVCFDSPLPILHYFIVRKTINESSFKLLFCLNLHAELLEDWVTNALENSVAACFLLLEKPWNRFIISIVFFFNRLCLTVFVDQNIPWMILHFHHRLHIFWAILEKCRLWRHKINIWFRRQNRISPFAINKDVPTSSPQLLLRA